MTGFNGEETHSIDDKGRVMIPAKMRKRLDTDAAVFNITRGLDKCVYAYPIEEWRKVEEVLRNLNPFDKRSRFLRRTFRRWSVEVSLDKQQRLTLPKKLLEFAEISDKTKIIGEDDHLEFWSPENYEQYEDSFEESFEDVAEEVLTLSAKNRE